MTADPSVVVGSQPITTVVVNTTTSQSVVVTPAAATQVQTSDVDYVYVTQPGLAGPPGPTGDQGPRGPQGPSGLLENTFTYRQDVPETVWTIVHNLGTFPNVTVLDSTGSQVMGDLVYLDGNTIRLTFSAAFSGVAYLI